MARFDVHPNPTRMMAEAAPYVLDLQSDHLSALPTRIVAPLAVLDDFQPAKNLNPIVEVKGERFAVMVNLLAAIPRNVLAPPVASLAEHRTDLIAALGFLFTGI